MKLIYRSRLIITLAVVLAGIIQVQAQEFKTNVSIREQMINGTVPGVQYGPKAIRSFQQAVILNTNENKQSLSEQIKNGTLGGLPVAAGGGGGHTFKANVQAAKAGGAPKPMASEAKPEVKQEEVKAVTLPTQGKEPVAEKTEAIKLPAPSMQGEKGSSTDKEPIKNNN